MIAHLLNRYADSYIYIRHYTGMPAEFRIDPGSSVRVAGEDPGRFIECRYFAVEIAVVPLQF